MSNPDDLDVNPYAAPKAELVFEDIAPLGAFLGYAGFWQRFVAYFIDSIILNVIMFVFRLFTMSLELSGFARRNNTAIMMAFASFNLIVNLAVSLGYYATMESSTSQATLGKMAMGLKVTDVYGQRITFGRAVGRSAGKFLSAMICYIGFIMAAFSERKQALHDQLAGTFVVRTR
jgi:uncharacterized RDD family membrane protein YckC